ncbi:MAG TPA: hypothetical protein VMD08_08940 [Candidatus Baltobacteraceae bacterium]|nr:hypothetical protein [Candidatus Baltobacteraceae bacterium]
MSELAVAALVIMAAVSLLWTVVLAVVSMNLFRLFRRGDDLLRVVEVELRPVLQDLREVLRKAQKVADGAAESTERVRSTLERLQGTAENLRNATGKIRAVISPRFLPAASLLAGITTGTKVLWKLYRGRRTS